MRTQRAAVKSHERADAAVEAARQVVLEQRGILEQWQQRLDDAQAELPRLRAGVGERALDDPGAATTISEKIARLQVFVSTAQQAVAAAGPRVARAEVAYLNAEAERLQLDVVDADHTLAEHEAATTKLLEQLADHDGVRYMPRYDLWRTLPWDSHGHAVGIDAGDNRVPLGRQLAFRAATARRMVAAVRAVAAGEDPRAELHDHDEVPACIWGPDALVPAEDYRAKIAAKRALIEDLEALLEELPAEIADIETNGVRTHPGLLPSPAANAHALGRLRARLDDVPAELDLARAELAELTGRESVPA